MFDEVDWPPQIIRLLREGFLFFAQLLFSYPVGYLVSMLLTAVLVRLGFSDRGPSVQFAGYEGLACLFMSPVVGWAAGRFKPSLVPTGRWIWILPVGLTLPDAVSELRHPSLYHLPSFLFASSEEGLGVALFTLPACCAAGYSVGMTLLTLDRRWPTSVRRTVTLSAAAVVLFCIFTAILHNFESTSIERWAKIRFW